jgi:hypothetical protein
VHGGGVTGTAHEYGMAVMVLAAMALIGTLLRQASASNLTPALKSARPSASATRRDRTMPPARASTTASSWHD